MLRSGNSRGSRLVFAVVVRSLLAVLAAGSPWMDQATAAPAVPVPTDPGSPGPAQPESGSPGCLTEISRSSNLLCDMWGLRTFLSRFGISLALTETSEVIGNVSGGVKQGFVYEGLAELVLQMDTQRAFGWYGGTFNASILNIQGSNLSAENLLTLQTASGIEADPGTRLWELWYDQKFGGENQFDVKIGQQSLDQEFMVSQNASIFVNTMFGWPMLPSADLPAGGPAYPLSAPGVRLRAHPTDSLTVLAGAFSGSPVSVDSGSPQLYGDPQQQNATGTVFPWNGTLVIAEVQYTYPSLGTTIPADQPEPVARTYKFGAWYDTLWFADQALDNTGLSLANPASTGVPLMHQGDWAVYGVADQMVWADPEDSGRNVNLFLRASWTPLTDRNLIDFSLNAGLTYHEPLPQRDDDIFGVGMGYAHVSPQAAALDASTASFCGCFNPVRSGEWFVEVTYVYQVTPWLQLQPDFQYVINPGAGIVNPNVPAQAVQNEVVLGLRATILF